MLGLMLKPKHTYTYTYIYMYMVIFLKELAISGIQNLHEVISMSFKN